MKDESSQTNRQFIIPIVLTLLTITLGLISFNSVFPEYSFWRKLYCTFQLFSMESGDRFYENGSQPVGIVILFNLARFLAIATLFITIVLAILSMLRRRYSLSRVKFMKDHTILCGLGEVGMAITENLPDKRRLVIIEKNADNENLLKLKKAGARIIEANALDCALLKRTGIHRANCLMALTGDDFINLTILNYALEQVESNHPDESKVILAANIDSRNLKAATMEEWKNRKDKTDCELGKKLADFYETANAIKKLKGNVEALAELGRKFEQEKALLLKYDPAEDHAGNNFQRIRLFNINQLAARYIFQLYPPDRFRSITKKSDKEMEILLLGWSEIGEELLKLFIQNCHYVNLRHVKIRLICPDADMVTDKIRSRYKNTLQIIDFHLEKLNPHYLTSKLLVQFDLIHTDVIYICSNEDRYQVSYSAKARELFGEKVPIVRPFYKNIILHHQESLNNLYSFPILNKVSNPEYIVDKLLDRKAIAVHHRWVRKALADYVSAVESCLSKDEDIPQPKPTLMPWYLLDEEICEDNRSVVEHLSIKLRAVGQLNDISHFSHPEKAIVDYDFLKDDSVVERLAEIEHRRWMATKLLYGWEQGNTRNTLLKEHESLIDYDQLDEETKNFDRDQIREMKEIIELKTD